MLKLWRNQRYTKKKSGLTAKQLAVALKRSEGRIDELLQTLRKEKLAARNGEHSTPLVVDGVSVYSGGRPVKRHRINFREVITWPSTATIVLRLFNYDGGDCSRQQLLQDVMAMGMIDKETKKEFTKDRLDKQIDFALDKGYLAFVPRHDDLLSIETEKDRAREEEKYLEAISKYAKRATTPSKGLL
jgi:hypothetical protein